MAKKKFYAVATGRKCGIFTDWATTENQVKGFPAAKFKSFPTEQQARDWLENPVYSQKKKSAERNVYSGSFYTAEPGEIVVYTDGGSLNNPGPGGYGVVIIDDGECHELSGGFRLTTNNRMEMMAAVVALTQLQECQKKVKIFSDSSYLVNSITKGWAKKWQTSGWKKSDGNSVVNRDLWQELLKLLKDLDVTFCWVKGHSGNAGNERCDKLAVAAARQSPQAVDTEYEQMVSR
jgi:ribonuclease HI